MFEGGVRHIWQVAIDGGDLQKLTTTGSDNQHASRVGDKLVYASARDGQLFNIWSMAVSTGVETQITATGGFHETDPHLSNDGNKLTFISTESGLARAMYASASGSGIAPVANNSSDPGAIEALPSWSPNSDKIVFSSIRGGGSMDLWITTTLGGVATRLSAPANSASAEVEAAWSTDNRIAFSTNRVGGGQSEVWITDPDGDPATKLTDGSSPTWLPDGRIVFVRYTGTVGSLFWVDPLNPSVVHPIVVTGVNAQRPSAVR